MDSRPEPLKITYPVQTGSYVVVLDVVTEQHPGYCVHGRCTCMGDCGNWLWLGPRTHQLVYAGDAVPMCVPCAAKVLPPGSEVVANLDDLGHSHGRRTPRPGTP